MTRDSLLYGSHYYTLQGLAFVYDTHVHSQKNYILARSRVYCTVMKRRAYICT